MDSLSSSVSEVRQESTYISADIADSDVNIIDVFDEIVMLEERFKNTGFCEGLKAGQLSGFQDGFRTGLLHGMKTGAEIGHYEGFARSWRVLLEKDTTLHKPNVLKAVVLLLDMITRCSWDDPTKDKMNEDIEKIRGKYKQNNDGAGHHILLPIR